MPQKDNVFEEILSGAMPDEETALYLTELADRGETVEEIVAAATALRGCSIPVQAPADAIDVCGTGGDQAGTLNISTAVSLVVSACGVPVAKHGNRAASSRSGATDVLEALGIRIDLSPAEAERQLNEQGIAFLSASFYHPALARLAPLRKSLGRRTIFNLLGPLLNPAKVSRQLVGVFSPDWVQPMAEALRRLGSQRAWVVHGEGLDELTVTGPSQVASLNDGVISTFDLDPRAFGFAYASFSALKGGSPIENATSLEQLLDGIHSAYRDIVLLNSAAALIVAGKTATINEGAAMARDAIDSGATKTLLNALRERSMS